MITNKRFRFITLSFVIWRVALEIVVRFGSYFIEKKEMFLGPVMWANFDGKHYLSIAERGYVQYEQAFFPGYPLAIRHLARVLSIPTDVAGQIVSVVSLYISLFILWELVTYIPGISKQNLPAIKRWSVVFMLIFPTSYYFISVYTESLFMLFTLAAFYVLAKKRRIWFALFAAVSSGVRLIGAFLLVPVGLLGYMYYLFRQSGDPLLFMHVQPAFGANRSGNELVILPQVYWRYLNIFIKVPIRNYDWWIALFEIVMFHLSLFLLWIAWKRKFPRVWIYFSLAAIILPTLTGTLSSMPRYVLAAFPIFIVLARMPSSFRKLLALVFIIMLAITATLFTQGYWIS